MVPASLSIWKQRAGRAGRTPTIQARAILLVQPTVFQEKAEKDAEDVAEGDPPKYKKDIEDGLRAWIETKGCRRDVADEYFDSVAERQRTYFVDSKFPQLVTGLKRLSAHRYLL